MKMVKTLVIIGVAISLIIVHNACGSYIKENIPSFSVREINMPAITTSDMIEIADVRSIWPGNEIVSTGLGLGVVCYYGSGDSWNNETLWRRPYDLDYTPKLAVGDIDPDIEGNEIVEGLYQLYLITYDNTTGNWTGIMLWDTYNETGGSLVHAIKIADFDPLHTGNELIVHGGNELREYYKVENGTWINKTLVAGEVSIELDVGDVTPLYPGNEIVCFTTNNLTILGWNTSSSWWDSIKVIIVEDAMWWDDGLCTAGRVGELNTSNENLEIVCGEKGSRILITVWWDGTNFERKVIYGLGIGTGEGLEFSTIAIGDCWSGHAGNEILAGTYWGDPSRIVLLWEDEGIWKNSIVFYCPQYQDPHDIEIGEFDTLHPMNEIAVGTGILFEIYENTNVTESMLLEQIYAAIVPMLCVVIGVLASGRAKKHS
ncbi:MAG: hypothetical protein QXU48_00430 [Thermoplasmata archaeon]